MVMVYTFYIFLSAKLLTDVLLIFFSYVNKYWAVMKVTIEGEFLHIAN